MAIDRKLGGLNHRNLLLTVWKAAKSKIKVPADWEPGEGLLLGLQTIIFLSCSHVTGEEAMKTNVI